MYSLHDPIKYFVLGQMPEPKPKLASIFGQYRNQLEQLEFKLEKKNWDLETCRKS